MHSLSSRAAHLCARGWLLLTHMAPTRPPPLRQYVVPRSAHEPRFSQAIAKATRLLKSSSPHLLLFQSLFFCIILSRNKRLGPRRSWMKRLRARVALSYYFARATVERVSRGLGACARAACARFCSTRNRLVAPSRVSSERSRGLHRPRHQPPRGRARSTQRRPPLALHQTARLRARLLGACASK